MVATTTDDSVGQTSKATEISESKGKHHTSSSIESSVCCNDNVDDDTIIQCETAIKQSSGFVGNSVVAKSDEKVSIDVIDPASVVNVNVGVLGHVDSGKTSLVKALSTLLSTAALDKSKQSRERGMTLDLGFSCFFLDIPDIIIQNVQGTKGCPSKPSKTFDKKTKFQITLVDCPGHASLIRTIIGGAQIIDFVFLVVDAVKGWQAQTTECLVLAEMLMTRHLIVALNKVDQFLPTERDAKIKEARVKIEQRLQNTRFGSSSRIKTPIVDVAACVGGQKVAAVSGGSDTINRHSIETLNLEKLIYALQEQIVQSPPIRRQQTKELFYFSVDHCFPIRGRGTVLTGTCLSGSASVNDNIEFPVLGLERKIKSIQMFKKQITTINQGDRAGICISSFDSDTFERGIIAYPGSIQLWKGAIALVRKVPYYQDPLHCNTRFHISVGHTTIMATLTFFGAHELNQGRNLYLLEHKENNNDDIVTQSSSLGSISGDSGDDVSNLPKLTFDFNQDFEHQDSYLESLGSADASSETSKSKQRTSKVIKEPPPLHWAVVHFHTPVHCPIHSLVIGSRLDTAIAPSDTNNTASAVGSYATSSSCRLAFSGRLIHRIEPEKDTQRIRLYTQKERIGSIASLGESYRRSDDNNLVRYEVVGSSLFKKETNMKVFIGMKVVTVSNDVGTIQSSFGTDGQFRVWFPAGTESKKGDALFLRFRRFLHDPEKAMHQNHIVLPNERPGARVENTCVGKNIKASNKLKKGIHRNGIIVSIKGDIVESNGKHNMAIISGFFAPEVNIKENSGTKVRILSTKEEGVVVGPFGKAGKCKVLFEEGTSANVGDKAIMLI